MRWRRGGQQPVVQAQHQRHLSAGGPWTHAADGQRDGGGHREAGPLPPLPETGQCAFEKDEINVPMALSVFRDGSVCRGSHFTLVPCQVEGRHGMKIKERESSLHVSLFQFTPTTTTVLL